MDNVSKKMGTFQTQFVESLTNELVIIRHLAAKLAESDLSYRPTPGQRTTLELLQYMSFVFSTFIESVITGDASLYKQNQEAAKAVTLTTFDGVLADQQAKISSLILPLTAEQLAEPVDIWRLAPRALHFLSVLKWAVGYKMQLFLYLKATGHSELSTMNLWRGTDPEPKA
jgi:hypothetical protein